MYFLFTNERLTRKVYGGGPSIDLKDSVVFTIGK